MSETEERRRKKKREEERRKQAQQQLERRKHRTLHDKHRERRKRDCMIGLPFILAFQGDPAQLFYCNDIPDRYELIPRTSKYGGLTPLQRLRTYMKHHVVHIAKKVLIYKAS